MQNSVRAEVEEYRKSGKVKLWIANCAIFYNLYKKSFSIDLLTTNAIYRDLLTLSEILNTWKS